MASLTGLGRARRAAIAPAATPRPQTQTGAVRDSVLVVVGGQVGRVVGTLTTLMLRWALDPARLGVYTGLRLALDNTNRTSLGVGLGAVQEIPVLRARGRLAEAQHVADVAHTANTVTCGVYALGLVGWSLWRAPAVAADPLAAEWTFGLIAVAALALLKRHESFLIAVLRAQHEFALTTRVDVVESVVMVAAVGVGLTLAGFWGLLAAVGVVVATKIVYLQARHPLRFRWAWDLAATARLMRAGLPILLNTALFGTVLTLDRMVILWRLPDADRAAGLYTLAVLCTSWSLDLSGRIVTVLATHFQTTLGKTRDPREVALQALRATEAQAPLLLAGGAVAYLLAPTFLGLLMPRYVDGLATIRPALPGAILLGLAWPARQALIAIARPYRLTFATGIGLLATLAATVVGADRAGIVGVARGMSVGSAVVAALTSAAAFAPSLGPAAWLAHSARLSINLAGFTAATLLVAHAPLSLPPLMALPARTLALAAWLAPTLWLWGRKHAWGGLLRGRPRLLQSVL